MGKMKTNRRILIKYADEYEMTNMKVLMDLLSCPVAKGGDGDVTVLSAQDCAGAFVYL